MMSKYISDFHQIYNREINYTSPLVQNELVEICAENVHSMIRAEVKKAGNFSIMCDEAR